MMRENFLSGKNFGESSGYSLNVEGEIVRRINLHELDRPTLKAFERKNRKIDGKVWQRGMWMGFPGWAQGFMCFMYVSIKGYSSGEEMLSITKW